MTINNFRSKLKLAVGAVAAGLALYGWSVLGTLENERKYDSLSNKDKITVDSLRRIGVEKGELRENIELMSIAMDALKQAQRAVDTQKDWEKDNKRSDSEAFNTLKARRIASFKDRLAFALDKLNKVNPKIFDTREIRARLAEAKKELTDLE